MARGDAVIYRSGIANGHQYHQPASGVEICITSVLITGYNNRAFMIDNTSTGELFPLFVGGTYTGDRTGHSFNMKVFSNNTSYFGMRTGGNYTIYYTMTGIQTK